MPAPDKSKEGKISIKLSINKFRIFLFIKSFLTLQTLRSVHANTNLKKKTTSNTLNIHTHKKKPVTFVGRFG